jgi:YidC/Oxa1 family membrane protein insertase
VKTDKNTIVGMILFFALFVGYSWYTAWKYPDYGKPVATRVPVEKDKAAGLPPTTAPEVVKEASAGAAQPVAGAATIEPVVAEKRQLKSDQARIETDTTRYEFDAASGGLVSVSLKKYDARLKDRKSDVQLLDSPLTFAGLTKLRGEVDPSTFQSERVNRNVRFWRTEGPWEIAQEYSIPEAGYGLSIKVTWRNNSDKPQDLNAVVRMSEDVAAAKATGGFFAGTPPEVLELIAAHSAETERSDLRSYCAQEERASALQMRDAEVKYLAIDKHYFLMAVMPELPKVSYIMERDDRMMGSLCPLSIKTYQPFGMIQPGETATFPLRAYFGPKDVDVMMAYDAHLKDSINLGWFTVIAHPLLVSLKFFYRYVGNYGIAILIITLILKILFYPLVKSSMVSMKRMQKLQPQMNALKEKFKDDKAKQQEALMRFMSENKINPAKGCLPMIPQIPVFIAFYNVLANAIELRHAPFYGWIVDLSAMDPYYIGPLLLGAGMFLQQKMTPTSGMDPAQEKMLLMMPVIFTVMMLSMPSGLVLYWLANTIISIAQQQWLNRRVAV